MTSPFQKTRLLSALAVLLAPALAFAQGLPNVDSDADGVNDAIDAAPCDPTVSARVFVPADRTWGMLMFEDNWPQRGDFDFNDAVLAYNQVLRYDSAGRLTGLRMELSVMAVGAGNVNGLALRLPGTPRQSVTSLNWSIANVPSSVAGEVRLDPNEQTATVILAENLHALFGVSQTRPWVNTDPNVAPLPYVDIAVEMGFDPGAQLSAADAPFDLFIFNRERGTEVHRPRYGGTANMNAALFNTADDGSTSTRHFVTNQGIPFALEFPELTNYAREESPIDLLYPGIVTFGASAGAQAQDFFRHPAPGFAFGITPPRSLVAQAAPNTSCFAPEPGVCGSATGSGSVNAPNSGLCGFGTASAVTASGGLWRWSCAGNYTDATSCTAPQWTCQPNLSYACNVPNGSGTQVCNGSGTGYGQCALTQCNSGYYQSGTSCVQQACAPGSVRACTVANGTGQQTCDNLGSAWGGCTATACNSGYALSNNQCTLVSSPTIPSVPWPAAPQLYCNGSCSWDPESHCGQGDADIFCRLRTGNTMNYALSYTTTTALPQPGFSCPGYGSNMGSAPQYGGPRYSSGYGYQVWTYNSSILSTHGPGTVINNVVCRF